MLWWYKHERVRQAGDRIGEILAPLALAVIVIFLFLSLILALDAELNPPSHEGQCVIFVWDSHPIYGNCPK